MAERILVLCANRRRTMSAMQADGVNMEPLLVVDRAALLPPESSKFSGVIVLDASPALVAEAGLRFPGLPPIDVATITPDPVEDEYEEDTGRWP